FFFMLYTFYARESAGVSEKFKLRLGWRSLNALRGADPLTRQSDRFQISRLAQATASNAKTRASCVDHVCTTRRFTEDDCCSICNLGTASRPIILGRRRYEKGRYFSINDCRARCRRVRDGCLSRRYHGDEGCAGRDSS